MNTITVKDGTTTYSHGWLLNANAWDAEMFFLGWRFGPVNTTPPVLR